MPPKLQLSPVTGKMLLMGGKLAIDPDCCPECCDGAELSSCRHHDIYLEEITAIDFVGSGTGAGGIGPGTSSLSCTSVLGTVNWPCCNWFNGTVPLSIFGFCGPDLGDTPSPPENELRCFCRGAVTTFCFDGSYQCFFNTNNCLDPGKVAHIFASTAYNPGDGKVYWCVEIGITWCEGVIGVGTVAYSQLFSYRSVDPIPLSFCGTYYRSKGTWALQLLAGPAPPHDDIICDFSGGTYSLDVT